MNYLESLQLLKSSFMGGTEVSIISKIINQHFENEININWLDIGIGDGQSLKKITGGLHSKFALKITGIDPLLTEPSTLLQMFDDAKLIPLEFEKYDTSSMFDVINVRQSFYYLDNREEAVLKILKLLHINGVLVITQWSDKDILSKLHKELFPQSTLNVTGEEIVHILTNKNSKGEIKVTEYVSQTNLSLWKQSNRMLEAAVTIIARRTVTTSEMPALTKKLKKIITEHNDYEPRINLVISFKKEYNV